MQARDGLALGLIGACAIALVYGVQQKRLDREAKVIADQAKIEKPKPPKPSKPVKDPRPPRMFADMKRSFKLDVNTASKFLLTDRLGDLYGLRVYEARPFKERSEYLALARTADEEWAGRHWLYIPSDQKSESPPSVE